MSEMKVRVRSLGGAIDSTITTLSMNLDKQYANVQERLSAIAKWSAKPQSARVVDRVCWLFDAVLVLAILAHAFKPI
jgi:hypothetical protein